MLTRRFLGCLTALLVVAASGAPGAAADMRAAVPAVSSAGQAPVIPLAFQLAGTNGYSIFVFAMQAPGGAPGSVQILARKGSSSVSYSAPAAVTETSIVAGLGALGHIAVSFHPSGEIVTQPSRCTGQDVTVLAGNLEGTIAFHGEEGYTEAETTSVPASVGPLLGALCAVSTGGGGRPNRRGAELYVRNPGLGPRFSALKTSRSGVARFFVGVSEYNGGISIERVADFSMPAASFRYSPKLQTATIRPPAPFSGTARFDRRKSAARRWSGDLTVDMPGLASAPLTGPFLRARLVHPESAAREGSFDGR